MNNDAAATSGISIGSAISVRSTTANRVLSRSISANPSASARLGTMVPAA